MSKFRDRTHKAALKAVKQLDDDASPEKVAERERIADEIRVERIEMDEKRSGPCAQGFGRIRECSTKLVPKVK